MVLNAYAQKNDCVQREMCTSLVYWAGIKSAQYTNWGKKIKFIVLDKYKYKRNASASRAKRLQGLN